MLSFSVLQRMIWLRQTYIHHLLAPSRLLLQLTINFLLSQINHHLVILYQQIFYHTIPSLLTFSLYNNLSYHHLILKLISLHVLTCYNKEITYLVHMHLLTFLLFLIQFTSLSSIVYYPPTLTHPSYTTTLLLAMNHTLPLLLLMVLLFLNVLDWTLLTSLVSPPPVLL